MQPNRKTALRHYTAMAAEARATAIVESVEAFALQVRRPVDVPLPMMPDELLESLGLFYEVHDIRSRGIPFAAFCADPYRFGWPVGHHRVRAISRPLTAEESTGC